MKEIIEKPIIEHPDVQRLIKQVVLLQAENKRLKEEHRWIPVSERLPKDSYDILAYGKDGFGYEIVTNTTYDLRFKKFRTLSDVTHWKPIILPEPASLTGEKMAGKAE